MYTPYQDPTQRIWALVTEALQGNRFKPDHYRLVPVQDSTHTQGLSNIVNKNQERPTGLNQPRHLNCSTIDLTLTFRIP